MLPRHRPGLVPTLAWGGLFAAFVVLAAVG
jgi:hypothetical protein